MKTTKLIVVHLEFQDVVLKIFQSGMQDACNHLVETLKLCLVIVGCVETDIRILFSSLYFLKKPLFILLHARHDISC